jgi:hypothetical protein
MAVGCFSCGLGFNGSTNELLRRYKKEFEQKGTERYFYKVNQTAPVEIARKESFMIIFERDIKPNFINGAEYNHIKEYGISQ